VGFEEIKMPKMKTKRAAKKRFQLSSKGKIKYKKSMKRHLLINKSTRMKRQARQPGYVSPVHREQVMACLPYDF
jgi:large subunit ribosomal protein L35